MNIAIRGAMDHLIKKKYKQKRELIQEIVSVLFL